MIGFISTILKDNCVYLLYIFHSVYEQVPFGGSLPV